MRFYLVAQSCALIAIIGTNVASMAYAQVSTTSRAEQTLAQSASRGQFTILVFYKADDAATQAMAGAVEKAIAPKAGEATLAFVQMTNPAEKKLVDQFAVSRAPMPLCLAIAPNGAVTGVFRKPPSVADLSKAFVTPTMTRCMKAMQDGKVVLVCVQGARRTPTPAAVAELQADPQFKDRTATVTLAIQDPAEADFLTQLEIDATDTSGVATVILAPPGVLVGKFPANASMSELATALHEAGKCCDDENCKHNKQHGGASKHNTTQNPTNTRRN
jgi:hypothetical protein